MPAPRRSFFVLMVCLLAAMVLILGMGVMLPASAQAPAAAVPGERVALLIGIANYKGQPNTGTSEWLRLQNAAKDARDIANELIAQGFLPGDIEVLQDEKATRQEIHAALLRLKKRATKARQIVVYIASHGVQVDAINYLIPIDAGPKDHLESTLKANAIKLEDITDSVSSLPGVKLILVDACRTTDGYVNKGDAGGLANPEVKQKIRPQTLVVFAAEAGQVANDSGPGQTNGWFAQGLIAGLRLPDPTLRHVMTHATREVRRLAAPKRQDVTTYGGLLDIQDDFRFGPAKILPPDPKVAELQKKYDDLLRQTQTPSTPSRPQLGQESSAWPGGPVFVTLPTGSYLRGSENEDGRDGDEGPVKTVSISYHLQMAKTEVTKGQFAQFVQESAYKTEAESTGQGCYAWIDNSWKLEASRNWKNPGFEQTDSHPVVCVSWNDAQKYVEWFNKKTGLSQSAANRYRLPTEAEWEFAARGVTSPTQNRSGAQHWRFYWGDDADYKQMCAYGNGADLTSKKTINWTTTNNCEDGFVYTAPVASFGNTAASRHPFGLHDLSGNVWEWTEDCYVGDYKAAPVDGTKAAETAGCRRVLRGGGWGDRPAYLRSAVRNSGSPVFRFNYVGLRLARTVF